MGKLKVLGLIACGSGLLWLSYLVVSILNFSAGSLSDRADAAIVLGAGVHQGIPSPVFAARIDHAVALYRAGRVGKLIFTGGVGVNNAIAESVAARSYAIAQGVPRADILTERKSRTTKQNLLYAKPIVESNRLKTVLLVSDALHMKRAMMIATDLGFDAISSATPTSRYQSMKTRLPFALRETYFYNQYLLFSE